MKRCCKFNFDPLNAKTIPLAKTLNIDLMDRDTMGLIYELFEDPDFPTVKLAYKKVAKKFNVTRDQLNAMVAKAQARKGVIIGLSTSGLDLGTITEGDDTYIGDMRVNIPGGFPIHEFSGIESLGPVEESYFNQLYEALVT